MPLPYQKTGKLTKYGMLYEGSNNFKQWENRFYTRLIEKYNYTPKRAKDFFKYEDHDLGNNLMRTFVFRDLSEGIRRRFPYNPPPVDLVLLEKMAQPFDLMGLPAELRVRILSSYLATFVGPYWDLDAHGFSGHLPPLFFACKSLRAEALPELYKSTVFSIYPEPNNLRRRSAIRRKIDVFDIAKRWKKNTSEKLLRNLRKVYLRFVHANTRCSMYLKYSKEKGLQADFQSSGAPTDYQEAVKKLIADVESERKEKGLQGEAILMALTTKLDIWRGVS